MTPALALLILLQQASGPALEVVSALNHDRVVPGDEVVLTVRVLSRGDEPIHINVPALPGFVLVARDERTEARRPGPGRTTTLELRLRAETPGDYRLGPFLVRQGMAFVQGGAVEVSVQGGGPGPSTALSLRLRRLLERAPPPGALGEAAVTVMLSADSVVVGDQVDVVTIAWFDREIRQQLRRAPTVEAPRLEGVWSYPQPVPGGIAWTRAVNGRWYDLFVLHQVVFPLTPGRVAVGRARLQYAMPLAFQFFSQEERYTLTSEPTSFRVWPVPDQGRPLDFSGAIGSGISVVPSLVPPSGRQGEAFTLDITLRGSGNVGLWPPPPLTWPAGLRAYPEGSRTSVSAADGRLSGSKTFRFLVVPDSAGTIRLPALRYSYFDPQARQYRTATAPPLGLVAAPAGEGRASRPLPPPLRPDRRQPLATSLRHAAPDAVWGGLLLLLPAAWGLSRVRWRRRRAAPVALPADPLGTAERRLDAALARLVPDPLERETALREALVRAGLEPGLAGRTAELRHELRAARYARAPGPPPDDSLVRRAEELLTALASRPARRRSRAAVLGLGLLALAVPLRAQSPEELYEAGAFRAAAAGFAARARQAPLVPAHWSNLGAARYRDGEDAGALAAWIAAARLRPRDPALRRALDLVPPADPGAARWLWIAPATPDELWLVAAAAWIAGWVGLIRSRRITGRWLVVLGGAILFAGAAIGLEYWYARPLAVTASPEPLRVSPHELAAPVGEAPRLAVVRLRAQRGPWRAVEDAEGRRGWLPAGILVAVGR